MSDRSWLAPDDTLRVVRYGDGKLTHIDAQGRLWYMGSHSGKLSVVE